MINAPHPLVAGLKRQGDGPVVAPMQRGIAPAMQSADHAQGQQCVGPYAAVSPVPESSQGKPPYRRCAVAFAFGVRHTCFAQCAGHAKCANAQATALWISWQMPDAHELCCRFRDQS